MDHELELIRAASQHHSLLTTSKVRELGISEARWARLRRAEVWIEVVPGVWRQTATAPTWELDVRAGSLWLGNEAGLHAGAALRWLGVEGFGNATVDFLVPRSRRHVPPWMNIHTPTSWSRGDFVRKEGVLCSTATRAIIDLAATATPRVVESAIDCVIRMRLTSVPTMTSRMQELASPGRTGTRLLRALLLDSGGESFLERELLRLVRRHGLPRPATQVAYRTGTNLAIRVDFEYVAHDVVVEVTGRRGHASDTDRGHDARRRNELQRIGKKVIEFTTAQVLDDPDYVITTLRAHLLVVA